MFKGLLIAWLFLLHALLFIQVIEWRPTIVKEYNHCSFQLTQTSDSVETDMYQCEDGHFIFIERRTK